MPMSEKSGMKEALREVVDKEIMVVVISQCEFSPALIAYSYFDPLHLLCEWVIGCTLIE